MAVWLVAVLYGADDGEVAAVAAAECAVFGEGFAHGAGCAEWHGFAVGDDDGFCACCLWVLLRQGTGAGYGAAGERLDCARVGGVSGCVAGGKEGCQLGVVLV